MRNILAPALLVLACLPFVVSAEAGFAKQSVFLSKSSVTEDEVVLVHAVVAGDAAGAFAGELVLSVADKKIGVVPLSLEAGEAQAVSVSWKPAAGTHTVVAELKNKEGKTVEKESASFYIKPKPQPAPPASQAASASRSVGSSQGIQESIANFSPKTAGAVAPVFAMIDSAREKAASFLDKKIAGAKAEVERRPGLVEGAQTEKLPDSANWFWTVLYTILLYLYTVLRFVVGTAGVFYPVLAIIILYLLWKLFRKFRRPAY